MTDQPKSQRNSSEFQWLLPAVLITAVVIYATCGSRQEIDTVKATARLIDVRTPEEFAEKHHPGAQNIPLSQIKADPNIVGDPSQEIIVYCRSGRRSKVAKKRLEKAGFTNVQNGGGLADMCRLTGEC